MKKARLILSASMLSIAAFSAVTFSSCSKDDTCETGYERVDGDCVPSSNKFIGSYSVKENCSESGEVGPYTAQITQSSTDKVKISLVNFGDFSATITINGTVDQNLLTIPQQTVSGYTIAGTTGTYNNGVITIAYSVTTATTDETCSATWTKQ